MTQRLFQFSAFLALGLAGFLGAGCESLVLGKPKGPVEVEGLRITEEQLRVRMRVMVNPLTGIVVDAADSIIADADDPEVRRAALVWKIDAVSAIREALFSPSPIAAMLDVWALSYQMIDYFATAPGAGSLKSYAPVALAASRAVNDYLENLTDGIVDDITNTAGREKAKTLLRNWATRNPIVTSIASRESISNQVTEISLALGMSLGEAVDTMISHLDDLVRKLEVYSVQVPNQARWQAELFTMDALQHLELQNSAEKLPALIDSAMETMDSMRDVPDVVAKEREIVLETLGVELSDTLETLQRERQIVMGQVSREREIVMDEIEANRIALTEFMRVERKALEQMVARERGALIDETEALRERLIEDFFLKMGVILVAVGLYLAAIVFVVLWFVDRRLGGGRPSGGGGDE